MGNICIKETGTENQVEQNNLNGYNGAFKTKESLNHKSRFSDNESVDSEVALRSDKSDCSNDACLTEKTFSKDNPKFFGSFSGNCEKDIYEDVNGEEVIGNSEASGHNYELVKNHRLRKEETRKNKSTRLEVARDSNSIDDRKDVTVTSRETETKEYQSNKKQSSVKNERSLEKVRSLVESCENSRWGKPKLDLSNEDLTIDDISSKWLSDNVTLQSMLQNLVLSGNIFEHFPGRISLQFKSLKSLELSQCHIKSLPMKWELPFLKYLDLSYNQLSEFPQQVIFEGIPGLQHLNLCGNNIKEILLPQVFCLRKITVLNLSNNNLTYVPDRIEFLASLRVLKLVNNAIERIPEQVCQMDLKILEVALNPLIQPPIETCERGLSSMRRYYRCLQLEEISRQKLILNSNGENKTEHDTKLLRWEIRRKKQALRRSFPYLARRMHRHSSYDSNEVQTVATTSTGGTASVNTPIQYEFENKHHRSSATQETYQSADGNLARLKTISSFEGICSSKTLSGEEQAEGLGKNDAFLSPFANGDRKRCSSEPLTKYEDMCEIKQSSITKSEPIFYVEPKQKLAGVVEVTPYTKSTDKRGNFEFESFHYSQNSVSDHISVNDTLKIIFVGVANAGKTSIIKRLIDGEHAIIPSKDERTVGVDIYEWNPLESKRKNFHNIDTSIVPEDDLTLVDPPVNVKFSVWDFAGQHVYHAAQELFFSERALYVLVWDMSATNPETKRKPRISDEEHGAFSLYDSSDDENESHFEEGIREADRALLTEIDEKVQFWVDCIQSNAPGAAILPVASFDDYFEGDPEEAIRRCTMLKDRLLIHEKRRINGLKQRYEELLENNAANTEFAERVRKLISPLHSPKLIFGQNEEDCVVRVSGSRYKGFQQLNERIISIATGRYLGNLNVPLFRGHIGARIPKMRLEVRGIIQSMREKFKVVEWYFFLTVLHEFGLVDVEDIKDSLHFLTDIGEISYFGSIMDYNELGLSQYIFLNPRWLVTAVSCILRHDIDNAILEARRLHNKSNHSMFDRSLISSEQFYDAHLNCPVITGEDACLLWQTKRITRKAVDRMLDHSHQMTMTPFEFLQRLLIRFRVFVPIDLSIEKTQLGGRDFCCHMKDLNRDGIVESSRVSKFFFLPSLLGPGEPSEVWTYKTNSSWKTTVCHSILFPESVPGGLMERITATVLSVVYAITKNDGVIRESLSLSSKNNRTHKIQKSDTENLEVKEILCWRSAFFLKIVKNFPASDGENLESTVEIFAHLVDRESSLCVASDSMLVGTRRLIVSANGQVGDFGRKIWSGGYSLVKTAISRAVHEYGGLEFEEQGICPECLAKKPISQASTWSATTMQVAAKRGEQQLRCYYGHRVDTKLVCGCIEENTEKITQQSIHDSAPPNIPESPPVSDLSLGVVLVGLWDSKEKKMIRMGSGFVVDKRKGLIVTACHTLINLSNNETTPFGEDYFGLPHGKAVIGVISRSKDSGEIEQKAVFRYFAQIVAKDDNIESRGICYVDACVLRITTKLEHDVECNYENIETTQEILLLHNQMAMQREQLYQLKVSKDECELDEHVRVLGFNQGGEGLADSSVSSVNRYFDFAKGYVCKRYRNEHHHDQSVFKPKAEIVAICPAIGGHSGGPCVNQQGEVIGILSRVDPANQQRCYLVPISEWKPMVRRARKAP